jgi:hypothetical protein
MKKASKPPATPKSKAPPNGVRRIDGSGHIDPAHAERLRELSSEGRDVDPRAFVEKSASGDDLAEELGEEAVIAMTTGQDDIPEERDAPVEEEQGGPFVETSAGTEFAGGTDESNIETATREPFPTT